MDLAIDQGLGILQCYLLHHMCLINVIKEHFSRYLLRPLKKSQIESIECWF